MIQRRIADRVAKQGLLDPRRRATLRKEYPDLARLDDIVGELTISVRTTNALEDMEISHIYQLLCCTREEVRAIPRCGEAALEEILVTLHRAGFIVKNWTPPAERENVPASSVSPSTTGNQVTTA
ncbi:MAG: DNA-directed RNA polymerase subunit alpha C-terminal domain-containing protein [Candidatus Peregrinibacteria bacterium]